MTYEVMWQCGGGQIVSWVLPGVIISSQLILQFLSLLAALCTCKVKVEVLNDSRYVKAIVVLTTINLTTTTTLSILLSGYQDLINATGVVGIFAGLITFLSLTFIPKVS